MFPHKKLTKTKQKSDSSKQKREEFFRLPRAESLLARRSEDAAGDIEKIVVNNRLELSDRFTINVEDNRMAEAGIHKGDFVVVQQKKNYPDGDIVVVKLGERMFIRRYFHSINRVRLECNTPDRQSMILDENTPGFSILGSVIQVIRSF